MQRMDRSRWPSAIATQPTKDRTPQAAPSATLLGSAPLDGLKGDSQAIERLGS